MTAQRAHGPQNPAPATLKIEAGPVVSVVLRSVTGSSRVAGG
jgi:hypothetical protein